MNHINLNCIIVCSILLSGCGGGTDVPLAEIDSNGCFVAESFDEMEHLCFLDCSDLNDDQCDALAEQIYGNLDDLIFEEFDGPSQGRSGGASDTETLVARYSVGSNLDLTTISNTQPDDDLQFRTIWQSALNFLPNALLQAELAEFQISTDGMDETLAFVELNENTLGKWNLAYDQTDFISARNPDFVHTSIHEFGHILFIGNGQVDFDATYDCDAFAIDEGCTRTDSYLNQFFVAFWEDIIDENVAANQDVEAGDDLAIDDFHSHYEERFVSTYAATNPIEDAAEVFTHFVLKEKPVASTDITTQKILFMHTFPELVSVRQTIRARLANR